MKPRKNLKASPTAKDENPPKIDEVRTDSALTQSEKSSDHHLMENRRTCYNKSYLQGRKGRTGRKEVKISDNFTTGHIAVITSFKLGTVYYVKGEVRGSGKQYRDFRTIFSAYSPKKTEYHSDHSFELKSSVGSEKSNDSLQLIRN